MIEHLPIKFIAKNQKILIFIKTYNHKNQIF
jgi:hypothetical protein